jgi:hypothetical protein
MKTTIIIHIAISIAIIALSFINVTTTGKPGNEFAVGVAPSLTQSGKKVHMVFASADSILYCFSTNNGECFSMPVLAGILPNLSVGGGRGPQIVSANGQLIIAVVNAAGNIYTFVKKNDVSIWEKGSRINDVPDIAKEAFVSLASNNRGEVFAVWLDLRDDQKNKIVGSKSLDAGATWSANKVIYRSPDSTVCECCKPSVEMKDQMVVVMFRNWLNGYRDLHVIQSTDGGINFGTAIKAGEGSWKLNGCPMDGGGLFIDMDNNIHTVWRRQGEIYSWTKGKKEEKIAEGRQCTIAGKNGRHYIAFVKDGKIYCRKPDGINVNLGKGSYPELLVTEAGKVLCAWENEGRINIASIK